MNRSSPMIKFLLLPLSWLYGLIVRFRNFLFDRKILKQQTYDIPIICVGNITVGGTGKTPHTEYLINLLLDNHKVAVLSRGYKRKTKGFRMVNVDSLPEEVGDEPLQMKKKFPQVLVAVDKNRRNGIEKLLDLAEKPDVILLDDGFQHRYVKPSLSVLLVDSNRPIYEDSLLPAGNLREQTNGKYRASVVVVTKCSEEMQPIDFRIMEEGLNLFAYQQLYFTGFNYGALKPLFPDLQSERMNLKELSQKHIYLVTGIAQPQPLVDMIKTKSHNVHTYLYPDHYFFKRDDIRKIMNDVNASDAQEENKIVITTEKDATRLRAFSNLDEDFKRKIYYLPIEVFFIKEKDQELFNEKIIKHVRNYQTNSRLSER